jgi:peptide deformylase
LKHLADLLLLGDPVLYQVSEPVLPSELPLVSGWVSDLHNVMQEIRERYHFGRAIAAPQLGILKRLIYVHIDRPVILLNPEIVQANEPMIELWDDCMSFPNLLVKVKRHKSIVMQYQDEKGQPREIKAEDGLSELLQHEFDHLNGILCTMRAIDDKSLRWRTFK